MEDDSHVRFRYFSELPTEIILIIATVLGYPDILRLRHANQRLRELFASYKDSISKDIIAFQFPHFVALKLYDIPRSATRLCYASAASYHVERAVAMAPHGCIDKEILRTGLYLATKISSVMTEDPDEIEMHIMYLAKMPAICLLFIHRATSIIAQVCIDSCQHFLFTAPVIGVPGGFEFNLVRRAVRLYCMSEGLTWAWEAMKSEDRGSEGDAKRVLRAFVQNFPHSILGNTPLAVMDYVFASRMRACLGEYGIESELDSDISCITRLGVGRRMQMLNEAGVTLADFERVVCECLGAP